MHPIPSPFALTLFTSFFLTKLVRIVNFLKNVIFLIPGFLFACLRMFFLDLSKKICNFTNLLYQLALGAEFFRPISNFNLKRSNAVFTRQIDFFRRWV